MLHRTQALLGCVVLMYSIKKNHVNDFFEYNCVVTPIEMLYNAHYYISVICMHMAMLW